MQPVRLSFVFTILNQNEFRIAAVAMFTCDLYAGSPPPHDLERLRTTMQRRVVDFVRVGYFIPLNGPLNGHPPSLFTIAFMLFLRGLSFRLEFLAFQFPLNILILSTCRFYLFVVTNYTALIQLIIHADG